MDPRLKHLNEAAHLLQSTSPSTAAYLQSRIGARLCHSILTKDGLATSELNEARRRAIHSARTRQFEICTACGHMSSKTAVDRVKLEEAQVASKQENPIVACQACFRETRLISRPVTPEGCPVPKPKPKPKPNSKSMSKPDVLSATTEAPASPMQKDSIAKPAATTSMSRKQKSRKASSLSAMLAKSKQDASSSQAGFGLDLMDLMKGT